MRIEVAISVACAILCLIMYFKMRLRMDEFLELTRPTPTPVLLLDEIHGLFPGTYLVAECDPKWLRSGQIVECWHEAEDKFYPIPTSYLQKVG